MMTMGKGVTINQYTTNNSTSNSNSYASSAALNQTLVYDTFRSQGKWEVKEKVFRMFHMLDTTKTTEFLNTLNPIQLMFTKIIVNQDALIVWYPEISDVKQVGAESKTNTTIDFKKIK